MRADNLLYLSVHGGNLVFLLFCNRNKRYKYPDVDNL